MRFTFLLNIRVNRQNFQLSHAFVRLLSNNGPLRKHEVDQIILLCSAIYDLKGNIDDSCVSVFFLQVLNTQCADRILL